MTESEAIVPLPNSRFGRAVLIGIVLGLLVVFAVAVSASMAAAQDVLPESPDKGAVGPPVGDPPLPERVKGAWPYPDNAVCNAWQKLESRDYESHIADANLSSNVTVLLGRLSQLCAMSLRDEDLRSGVGVGWISLGDGLFDVITMSIADRMQRPIGAKDRPILQAFLQDVAVFQRDFQLERLKVYQAVREVPREVVRTIEVPARCPEPAPVVRVPEPPPPPRDPCADALRQGADRWANQLYKWTSWYRGSGADWALADDSKSDLRDIANGHGDPRSYVIGWLAQWRSIRRQDSTSFLGSGPMSQVAADMRAQLSSCGIYQEER